MLWLCSRSIFLSYVKMGDQSRKAILYERLEGVSGGEASQRMRR